MQSDQPTIINAAGAQMPVTNVVFHENFIVAYTDTISVRFEKVGDEFKNGDFKITGDLSRFMPVATAETVAEEAAPAPVPEPTPAPTTEETAIEDETTDVVVDADATVGVDLAAEGGDAAVETVVEPTEPVAPVTTE